MDTSDVSLAGSYTLSANIGFVGYRQEGTLKPWGLYVYNIELVDFCEDNTGVHLTATRDTALEISWEVTYDSQSSDEDSEIVS